MAGKIAFKTGKGHHTPPYGNVKYADPKNHKYPIDKAHIRAAVSYYNHPGEQHKGGYSASEWHAIGSRIAAAANREIGPGHHVKGGKIDRATGAAHAGKALKRSHVASMKRKEHAVERAHPGRKTNEERKLEGEISRATGRKYTGAQ